MSTLEEYKEQMAPTLQKLEAIRLVELKKTKQIKAYYLIPAVLAILTIPIYWKVNPIMAFVVFGIALAIGFHIATNVMSQPVNEYLTNLKKQVFTSFAKTVFLKVTYHADKKVAHKAFLNADLFAYPPSDYEGKDYFKGQTKEGFKFQFSNILVTKDTTVLFEGLFFELQMPTNFQSKVIVLPNKDKQSTKVVNSLNQLSLKGLTADGDLVAVANVYPKFENDFTVYSHSKEMAYHILVPAIIQGIQAIHQEWKTKPRISFVNNKIYVAISSQTSSYLPTFHVSLLDNPMLVQLLEELSKTFRVVNHLCVHTIYEKEKMTPKKASKNQDFPVEDE